MAAARLLSRRRLLPLRNGFIHPSASQLPSPFKPIPNPNNSPSSSFLHRFAGDRLHRCPNPHPLPGGVLHRFFSWHAGADDPQEEGISGDGLELSAVDLSGLSNLEIAQSAVESEWYLPLLRPIISLFEGVHDLTGFPWWVVILTSTLAFRIALLPVLILQLKKVGEITLLLPKLPPPFPPPLSGMSFKDQYLLFKKKRQELGCPSYLWNFAFAAVQLPCFLLWMTSIRRMCLDHHPGFDNGGTLWFQNLTDFPHGILGPIFPILVAGLHYIIVQISFQRFKVVELKGILGLLIKYYKTYLDVLAIPLLLIGFCVPQGSLVYWVASSSLTVIQQLSLRNPLVRQKLGLPDEGIPMKNKISTKKDLHESSSMLEAKISAETASPEKLLDLALNYLATGRHDEALPLLRLATGRDPELVQALVAMGQIFCSKSLFVEAVEYFERAIPKVPEEEVGLLVLATFGAAVSHNLQGRRSEAIAHLKRITQLREPEKPLEKACYYQGFTMLGSFLFEQGDKCEAAKYLRIAVTYDPGVNAFLKECEEG